jgi:transposase
MGVGISSPGGTRSTSVGLATTEGFDGNVCRTRRVAEATSICVVDQTGKVLCEGTVNSTPEAIVEFVKLKAAGAIRIGLETGPTSTWLWTSIKGLGLPVICIDARHAKAVLKMQINKSDRNDALGIARIMQCGWYKEVRVKSLDSHAMRGRPTRSLHS